MSAQRVFVTGASRGIGRAIAMRFLEGGARVAAVARTVDALRQFESAHPDLARVWQLDVTDRVAVDRVVGEAADAFGGLDVIVNNAGLGKRTPIDSPDDDRWRAVIDTNLLAPMYIVRAALPHLSKGSRVINISSQLGKVGVPLAGAYCASKHGLIGWTRSLALELAPRDIQVNAVCPGWVETDMANDVIAETSSTVGKPTDELKTKLVAETPQRRFLDPTEIADLVAYLATPAAKGITGQALSICGGQTPY